MKAALAERQMPVEQTEIAAQTKIEKVAELWLAEIERADHDELLVGAALLHDIGYAPDLARY